MASKLAILTEIIAPYRIPVFNALAKRKEIDLHVIFLSENDPVSRQWRVYKEEIRFPYDVLPSWRHRVGEHNILINAGLFQTLTRIGPDAVLCGGYNYLASWQAAWWAKCHRVPLMLWSESTALDQRDRHPLVEFAKTRFLNLCAGFIVPGIAATNYLQAFGIAPGRISVAPNAVDIELFSSGSNRARENETQTRAELNLPSRYFLYVGRLVRAKGVFDAVEAYSRVDAKIRREVGLVLVGDGADRFELMERASRINPGTVRFAGFVQRENLPAFYGLAEAFVLPTHSDVWGLVVNEAMSCRLPIIVSDVAGCATDLVKDEWNGFVVPARDCSQFAARMTFMASDSAMREEMGMRSRQRIDAYSPEAWSDGVVTAARAICRGGW